MTCHCGNCEDHRVDSWKMFDHEDIQWTETTPDIVKEELMLQHLGVDSGRSQSLAPNLSSLPREVKQVDILILVNERKTTVQAHYQGDIIYDVETGIGANEMGFLFQSTVIPLRDMVEALGFECSTEVVKNV